MGFNTGGGGAMGRIRQSMGQPQPGGGSPPPRATMGNIRDAAVAARGGVDPRAMPPQQTTNGPGRPAPSMGAPMVQNLPMKSTGLQDPRQMATTNPVGPQFQPGSKPQMDPRAMPPQPGGNPMQKQMMQARQMRGSRGPRGGRNPTGNRMPMRGGMRGGGRGRMY